MFQTHAKENRRTPYPAKYSKGSKEVHVLWLPYQHGWEVICRIWDPMNSLSWRNQKKHLSKSLLFVAQIPVIRNRTKVTVIYFWKCMLCVYVQSFKLVVILKAISFKDKGTKSGHQWHIFYCCSYKHPMSSFIPLNLFHLASWFLPPKLVSYVPVIHWLCLLILFPVPFLVFMENFYFPTSTSDLPVFYHSPHYWLPHALVCQETFFLLFFFLPFIFFP